MANKLRTPIQLFFLILFVILIIVEKVQIWLGIFLSSVFLTVFFGRYYCGFICPINTVTGFITRAKKRLKIKSTPVPEVLKKPFFRYGMFFVFILAFGFAIVWGKKLPVLPVLFLAGVVLTLFF